jgi:molybdopterin synthase catalytic subunit
MFILTDENISQQQILEWKNTYTSPTNGAAVTFEGLVRNHNDGKEVSSLEYMAYHEMAIKVGTHIINKAKMLYPVSDLFCVHRTGHLQIGEIAVWIIATSSHRKEAFDACQFVIDEVKKLVPIWKKEHYLHEVPDWVQCHHCGNHQHG